MDLRVKPFMELTLIQESLKFRPRLSNSFLEKQKQHQGTSN